jgi:rhodanese-related sulfurtransferase/glyoxylase-like metal-dependent hydrolase (beta-lactamase superfamily II)
MIEFQQFYLTCLAQASYLIGSEGVAAVVDPQRDVDLYLDEAAKRGLKIAHVIETHLHADFVSGHRELAAKTGATVHLGARAGAGFPHHAVKDGDEVRFGRCVMRFLETPGHTTESISVLVLDLDKGDEPFAVLTGDTLFIGDVGRPDLSNEHSPQELAGMLYDSLHGKLLTLPDATAVYPAHGAGSLCGKSMSSERSSTIGRQKETNYALRPMPKEDFVAMMTTDLPERPAYFARDVEINRSGASALGDLPPLARLAPADVASRQSKGAVVLDTRSAAEFGAGHVPASVHIGLSGQFASWAGTLLGLDQAIVLVGEDPERCAEARVRLARVGIEHVVGVLDGGIEAWQAAGLPLETTPQVSVQDLGEMLHGDEPPQLVDVRRGPEFSGGHVAAFDNRPLDALMKRLDGLDRDRRVAVLCASGYRSSIAASLLERAGFRDVVNVTGGINAWKACGLPVESAAAADA